MLAECHRHIFVRQSARSFISPLCVFVIFSQDIFDQADANADGVISFDEYLQMMGAAPDSQHRYQCMFKVSGLPT